MTRPTKPPITITTLNAANVNFGEQEFHRDVTFVYHGAPSADTATQERLTALYQQLANALAALPADQARDAQAVQMAAEDALVEAEKEQPDKGRLQIRADALMAAAKNLLTVAPIAVEIAKTLLMLPS